MKERDLSGKREIEKRDEVIMMETGKKRILIIEDDEEMRSLLKEFLNEEGYETDSVDNGSEAYRRLVRELFDLIITDIRMPGLTGLDILPGVRKLQPEAPIIVITAFGSEEVHHKVFERGATAYLEKPIHLENLRDLVQRIVSSKERVVRGKEAIERADS
jgi:DNA-binding response OmpR family regulator